MSLTGELSDLSLAELIEFFCNQRKTGRLKVIYSIGPGYFYLQSGSVVHARIGILRGIEAVYYALTLPNASFTFSPAFEAPEQTINQPWTSVVLEGLRRMDEGVVPHDPFPEGHHAHLEESKAEEPKPVESVAVESQAVESQPITQTVVAEHKEQVRPVVSQKFEKPVFMTPAHELPDMGAFLSQTDSSARFGSWKLLAVIAAVALIVGVIAVPWGWYARSKARLANDAQAAPVQSSQPAAQTANVNETPVSPVASDSVAPETSSDAADLAAKHQREARAAKEKERAAKAQDTVAGPGLSSPTPAPVSVAPKTQSTAQSSPASGSKKATVQVTYDENGRVTQASGGDATALRIARQKRFPAGKAGSATITIPIN
jgi:cytoskeletal protein RodZ